MKKLSILILCFILTLTVLTGCNNTDENNITTPNKETTEDTEQKIEVTEPKKEEIIKEEKKEPEEIIENDVLWELKELDTPEMPELKIEKVTIPNTEIEFSLIKTPFDYTIDDFKKVADSSEYINSLYSLATQTSEWIEDGQTFEEGNFVKYSIRNSIIGVKKEKDSENNKYFNDFSLKLIKNTNESLSIDEMSFLFAGPEISTATQKEIYKVLKDCIGEEYAEFLVYGPKTEGIYDMKTRIPTENGTYVFTREVKDADKYNDPSFRFSLYVTDTYLNNAIDLYDGEYTSIYEKDYKYMVSDIVPNLNDFSFKTFDKFGSEFYNQTSLGEKYVRTLLDFVTISKIESYDGKAIYDVDIAVKKGSDGEVILISPVMDVEYEIFEKDGNIKSFEITVGNESGFKIDESEGEAGHKKIIDLFKTQINLLMPDVDISEISIDNLENGTNQTIENTSTILGKECETEIKINSKLSSGTGLLNGEWSITAKYSE